MVKRPPKPEDREAKPRFQQKKASSKQPPKIVTFDELIEPLFAAMEEAEHLPFMRKGLDDRGKVIIAASFLEEWLKVAMVVKFRVEPTTTQMKEVFSNNGGPLSTFANKIAFGAVMGLIDTPEMRHDLDIIRWIRNQFAHTYIVRSLEDEDVRQQIARLQLRTPITKGKGPKRESERHFLESCFAICIKLLTTTIRANFEYAILKVNSARIEELTRKQLLSFARTLKDEPAPSPGKSG